MECHPTVPKARALICSLAGIALAGMIATPLRATEISYEFDANESYVSAARTALANGQHAGISEQSSLARFVISPQIKEGLLLRFGAEWRRYSFGFPEKAALPNTLQSFSLVVGVDTQLGESWLLRAEALPGFYAGSHVTGQDFNVPFVAGASYLASPELQWVLGVEVDPNGQYPVLPGAGVRWKFADRWLLNAILPAPRLEYEFSKSLTVYGGLEFKTGTYRMERGFGTGHGNPKLNGAVLDYLELRAGAGAAWKVFHWATLEFEGGYLPYRKFDYFRVGLSGETRSGAPYVQIAVAARF